MKKPVILITLLLLSIFGFGQNNKPYVIRYQSQGDIIQHNTQTVSGIHIDSLGQTLTHDNGVEWSALSDLDTVYIYRGYFRIQQTDLQNWDFGIVSHNNNVVLVKEEDEDDGSSHVLILMHQIEDTLSFTYQNDTLTDLYYNSYHFMVSEIDTMLLFTTIDGDTAVSYAIPFYEHIAKCNSKGTVSTLLYSTEQIISGIFNAESGINMLVDIESGDRESLIHDLGEMSIEGVLGFIRQGPGAVISYELWKHYINRLQKKALQFHLGNASCTIQSIQQNESNNTIDVTVSVINGEDIPNNYRWKHYSGQHVISENIVYYGLLCRAGNNFPTIQKYDYDSRDSLPRPHASITYTFSFPVMAVEKILFRPYLCFKYNYHDTALQNDYIYKYISLARYGEVEEFYPEFEINTIASPTEGGTVTDGGRYPFNTQITLTATANSGYEFTHWEDGSASNPRVITVEGDATYTAFFEGPLFDINIIASPSEGGTVSGSGRYPVNTTIITTATANSGYEFTHWEDGSESNPRVIIVEGDATYTAYFEPAEPTPGDWVDLGLPSGLLWATRNVGASSPEDYGDYFAWGETQPKSLYENCNYQYWFCYDSHHYIGSVYYDCYDCYLTKYCHNSFASYNGFTDNLTTLLPEDDAATANWGGGARTPTKEEWQELRNNCTSVWTTRNGVNGSLFTGPNGNTLFLPAAGYNYGGVTDDWSVGVYWSSLLSYPDFSYDDGAWAFHIQGFYYPYQTKVYVCGRVAGCSVRAVREN